VPYNDQYFLTRVGFGKTLQDTSFRPEPGIMARMMHGLSKEYKTEFIGQGFSWMMLMDLRGLDRAHYSFDYQGREFLGDLRCIVIDVTPRAAPVRTFRWTHLGGRPRLQHCPLQRNLYPLHAWPIHAL